jgi:hypothetical protein
MITLKEKYKNYRYSREVINSIYSYLKPQVHLFPIKEQNGGSIDKINKIIKKYANVDIEVDILESTDKEVRAVIFNFNKQITCASLVINFTDKIAEIADLRSDKTCIKNNDGNKKIMASLMHIIIGICKSSGMKLIRLSDHSYHHCTDSKYSFKLDVANFLTDGEPYYYKYGFKYEDENDHYIIKNNSNKLKKIKTIDVPLEKIIKIIKKKVNNTDILIPQVTKIYNKYLDVSIMNFLKELKYWNCPLFALIYTKIVVLLKFETINKNVMVYLIKKSSNKSSKKLTKKPITI